jgi:MFS family permease
LKSKTVEKVKVRLPAAVYALGLTSLLNDAASDMIYPLLPVFLASLSGVAASPAAGAAVLGVVEGLAEAMSAFIKLASGHASDRRRRRKPFVVVGYVVAGLVRPFLALVSTATGVLVVRLIDRFGKGLRSSPRDALIADVVPAAHRGRAFGVHEAMDHAGAVVGPLLASLLIGLGASLPTVFLVSAIPALLACLVVGFLVHEPRSHVAIPADVVQEVAVAPPPQVAPGTRILSRPFAGYLMAVTVFSLAGSADVFLLLRAREVGFSVAGLSLVWALHNGVKALATTHGGALADRFGRRRAIGAGWVVYALAYLGFARATGRTEIVALFLVYALHYALSAGAQKALVAELVPASARARGYGLYHVCLGVTLLPASVLFGLLYQKQGATVAFATGAGLALAATLLLPLSRIRPGAR